MLGYYRGLFTKMFLAKYLIQFMIEIRVIFYIFEKDVFEGNLALFHMKEHLIL